MAQQTADQTREQRINEEVRKELAQQRPLRYRVTSTDVVQAVKTYYDRLSKGVAGNRRGVNPS